MACAAHPGRVRGGLRPAGRARLGTLDELFEALTLAQTRKVTQFPIVLLGTAYWSGLLDWMRDTQLAEGKISQSDLDMMVLTDDVDEAVALMVAAREQEDRAG